MELELLFSSGLRKANVQAEHAHPYWELIGIVGGRGSIVQDGHERAFADGDIICNPPHMRHTTIFNQACRCIVLGCNGIDAPGLGSGVIHGDAPLTRDFAVIAEEAASNQPLQRTLITHVAATALCRIRRHLDTHTATGGPAGAIKALIDDHFDQALDLDTLAGRVYLSKDYVRHLFKREFGVSPIQYLISQRLEAAQTLLRSGNETIASIAARCGFHDAFYFSQLFKRQFGQSPSAWRATVSSRD